MPALAAGEDANGHNSALTPQNGGRPANDKQIERHDMHAPPVHQGRLLVAVFARSAPSGFLCPQLLHENTRSFIAGTSLWAQVAPSAQGCGGEGGSSWGIDKPSTIKTLAD